MNQILNNHADWLDYNVSKVAGDKCRKQAIAFAEKDLRQKGVRKHDRSNKVGDRSSPVSYTHLTLPTILLV